MNNKHYIFLTCTYYDTRKPEYFLHIINEMGLDYSTRLDSRNGRKALLLLEKRAGHAAEMNVNQYDRNISYKTIEVYV